MLEGIHFLQVSYVIVVVTPASILAVAAAYLNQTLSEASIQEKMKTTAMLRKTMVPERDSVHDHRPKLQAPAGSHHQIACNNIELKKIDNEPPRVRPLSKPLSIPTFENTHTFPIFSLFFLSPTFSLSLPDTLAAKN